MTWSPAFDPRNDPKAIAKARELDGLDRLAAGLITVPDLRIDSDEHQQRLAATVLIALDG